MTLPDVAIVPLVDEGLGNSAYVVDLGDGGALVIDLERDPRPYLEVLERCAITNAITRTTAVDGPSCSASPVAPSRVLSTVSL